MNSSDKTNQCCVICLEPLSSHTGVIDCGHMFCASCITHWIQQSSSCPLCRKEITKIRIFYRSFFMGDEIKVEHKQQKVDENEDEIGESDFEISDSDEELIFFSQNSQKDTIEYDENCGTSFSNGLRRSTRESHPDFELQEALLQFQIQLQQTNTTQELIRRQLRYLMSYIDSLQESHTIDQQRAQKLVDEISEEIKSENGQCNNQKIKQFVDNQIFKKSLQKLADIPKKSRHSLNL